jgi:hypothetical protein
MAHLREPTGASARKRRRALPTAIAAMLAASASMPMALAGPSSSAVEDTLKAIFIYKFAPFVTWPSSLPKSDPLTICVAGTGGVASQLPQVVAGQKVDDRSIAVETLSGGNVPGECRVLYIADSTPAGPWLAQARGKAILTITDNEGPDHGVTQLVVIDHHVRFDVDTELAAADNLAISSKLLSLAHAVTPAPRGGNG